MRPASHILAIDPGTNMGVARWEMGGEVWSDTEELSGRTTGAKLDAAHKFLSRKFEFFEARDRRIEKVVVEDFHATGFRGGGSNAVTTEFLTKLRGVIEQVSYQHRIPCSAVASQTWRKSFLGYGRAPKGKKIDWKAVCVARCKGLGWAPNKHDEAEALGILFYAVSGDHPSFSIEKTPLFLGAA